MGFHVSEVSIYSCIRLGRLKAELDAVRTQLTQLNDKEKPNG